MPVDESFTSAFERATEALEPTWSFDSEEEPTGQVENSDGTDGDGNVDPEQEDDETPAEEEEEGGQGDDDTDSDEEGDEDDEDDEETGEALEVDEEAKYKIGEDVYTGRELKDGFLRRDDYTKKTQELKQERQEFEENRDRVLDEVGHEVAQLVEQDLTQQLTENPAGWAAHLAINSGDPGYVAVAMLSLLHENQALPDELSEILGFGKPDSPAANVQLKGEVEQLKRQQEAERERREQEERDRQQKTQQQQRTQEIIRGWHESWEQLKQSENIQFKSEQAEQEEFAEVLREAANRQTDDLAGVWASRELKRERERQQRKQQQVKSKRQNQAISRKSQPARPSQPKPTGDISEALSRAAAQLETR